MTKSFIFIDTRVADYQSLLASLDPQAEVKLLSADRDGLLQIARHLHGRSELDAIHILSHGNPGLLKLGSAVVSSGNLASYADTLADIGEALAEGGDILLYGCNVAAGKAGQAFIGQLAELTGADVAASTTPTGAAELGGDWLLQARIGSIEAATIAATGYGGLLIEPDNTAPSFFIGNRDGKVTTDFGSTDPAYSMAIQTDGKILLGGYSNSNFALARYNTNGTLDTTFDGDGMVTTDLGGTDQAYSMAIQADGKILLAGYNGSDFVLVRYNTDGSLDTSFGVGGIVTTDFGGTDECNSMTLDADGKILLAGTSNSNFALARYNTDGSLDTTFDGDGKLTTDFGGSETGNAVTVDADGKILLTGYASAPSDENTALARYNADGSLDTTFDGDGKVVIDYYPAGSSSGISYSVTVDADGKILLGGNFDGNFGLLRFNADGTLDTANFGSGGIVSTNLGGDDEGHSVTMQADGKILLGGFSDNNFALARYNADGTLDTSFGGGDGIVTTDFGSTDKGYSVTVDADGKILLGGYSSWNFALARYNADGTLDTSFDAINTLNGAPGYTQGGAAVVLDNDVEIDDAELAAGDNYAGATLTLARNGGASADDQFSGAGITAGAASGNVTVSSTTIGTYTWTAGELLITFDANATQALVNEVLQSLAYSNAATFPPASVQIDWTFDDGNTGSQGLGGALATTGSTTVSITQINFQGTAGADTLNGTSVANILDGLGGNDILNGNGGDDRLDGGTGADAMSGGAGNDTYIVDNAGDTVAEASAEGTDLVKSSVTFTLGANVEKLTLTGTSVINGTGNALDNLLTGNIAANLLRGLDGNDTLNGGGGNDTLDGGAGADTMRGNAGNDTYIVNSTSDRAIELTGEGTDLVKSSVTFTLGANVEKLTLTGTNAINGTGNTLNNVLTGNIAANVLKGLDGNDILNGGGGNDTLDGGAGADTMRGNAGNDTYIVNSTSDKAIELSGEGSDLVKSSVTFTLGANVEKLTLTGTNVVNGTGNGAANVLTGNGVGNILMGLGGNDTLLGGAGKDVLIGGAGNDYFVFNTTLNATTNVDAIKDFSAVADTIRLENSIFKKLVVTGALNADNYRENAAGVAKDANDYIIFSTDTGKLYYDADGNGAGAKVHFATIYSSGTTPATLSAADFVVI